MPATKGNRINHRRKSEIMGQGTDEEGGMIVTKLFLTGALFFILTTVFMRWIDEEDTSDFFAFIMAVTWVLSIFIMIISLLLLIWL